ncbi:NUDIX hydrolase [Sphaerisporangium corydalis]|uniref:NUDIX hydrolase n=1 Tax=Sphaerisporangium corydalis TaxID=1441875 RepID=A0ABV9EG25_9ACTN|nr:NUDIX domain-containing protein [Sphaerisporangium corydalis]
MRVRCVGGIVLGEERLLLVLRGHPPGEGLWSLPGGRVEPGESDVAALEREMLEETGLSVTVGAWAGSVERPGPGGVVYEIHDYYAVPTGGTPRAGDDAAGVGWFPLAGLDRLPLTSGLLAALTDWRVVTPSDGRVSD